MQTLALLIDSWRLLRSRKLFWITLAINLITILAYGSIAFTPTGVSILFGMKSFDVEELRMGMPLAREGYLLLFSEFIVRYWLGWIAVALAVMSTASIFPDLLSEGAIDLVLAKPITRLRVFLVKYMGSLLFVLFQVATFCIGAFFAVGARLHEWNFGLFMAIPLVVLFFSYLYCINVLVGVITRSTLAALIATVLFWSLLFGAQSATDWVAFATYVKEADAGRNQVSVDQFDRRLEDLGQSGQDSSNSDQFERVRGQREAARIDMEKNTASAASLRQWLSGVRIAAAALPKHHGTLSVIDRWVRKDWQRASTEIRPQQSRDGFESWRDAGDRIEKEQKAESAWWIVGSSVGFELVILAIAAWVFSRKDF